MLFHKELNEKKLVNYMLELVYKSNALIELVNPHDSLKLLEMSINKNDIIRKQNYQAQLPTYSGKIKASYDQTW